MSIEIRAEAKFSGRLDRADLRRVVRRTLRAEEVSPRESVTIVVVGDKMIRDLNRRFHHRNAPTDVLSFPSDEQDYLGDIFISYETARENARAAHWRIRDELRLLVVHGVLHLLGYDDLHPRARAQMWRRQEELLGKAIREPQARGERVSARWPKG